MPQDSKAVANYFLDLAKRDHKKLTPIKLQKLVYFAHGWYLAIHNQPLIDDIVEAWRFGPVIPTLYHEFKEFGNLPITRQAYEFAPCGDKMGLIAPQLTADVDKDLLETVWKSYGDLTASQLSNATHEPGTPWEKTWSKEPGRKNLDISDELIREYFVEQMNAAAA